MLDCFVIKANTKTGDDIIDRSIELFKYQDVNCICVNEDGAILIDKEETVKQILQIEDEDITIEELCDRYYKFKLEENKSM